VSHELEKKLIHVTRHIEKCMTSGNVTMQCRHILP